MERGFSLMKRMKKTDFYIAFSDMIFRHLHLYPPRIIGEKSFFFYQSFSAKSAKIRVLLKILNGTLKCSISHIVINSNSSNIKILKNTIIFAAL
jgi:hypothetical protein